VPPLPSATGENETDNCPSIRLPKRATPELVDIVNNGGGARSETFGDVDCQFEKVTGAPSFELITAHDDDEEEEADEADNADDDNELSSAVFMFEPTMSDNNGADIVSEH
jgi:hypothetical protein